MRFTLVLSVLLALSSSEILDAADPQLTLILPRGAQRGTEQVFRFSGARLQDAEEIFFYEPGFVVKGITPVNANSIDVTIEIAADCELGEHTAQVRTKSGISDYRTFFVGALPSIDEKEPNTDFSSPQPIPLNVTVHGVIDNEDVDYFVVEATKGQRLSAEVEGMRFGQVLFDPYIAILDERRFELAAVDDSPLVRQDAVASIVVPEDGRYIIEVRESGYGGNGNCRYRLHVGTFPRPLAVFPAGGRAGEEVELTFLGDALGPIVRTLKLPDDGSAETSVFPEDELGIAPSGHVIRIAPDSNSFEAEPNNTFEQATFVEFPSAFNGILQEPGDVDFYRFTAVKGQTYEVECLGRRIRSAIDTVMNLYQGDGKSLAGNDDSRGPDSYFRFQVPEDGEYVLRITDHLGRGGPEYTYRVEFQEVKPSLSLGIPRVARYSQSRQRIFVPQGGRFASLISAERLNFGGELVMEEIELPPGVTITALPMRADQNVMPVVFEAAADAPLSGSLVDFRMRPADTALQVSGRFKNRADFVIAGPGQSLYVWKDVDRLPMAVVEELPFSIELVQPNVPVVRNGQMDLKVVVTKKEGWDEQITVQFPYRPPGIGANSSITIAKGESTGLYQINANGNASIGEWPVYCIASADVDGAAWTSSQMATLEIAEPYLNIALKRASVELGQETEIIAEVQVLKDLQSPAEVTLLGLPHKVTAEPLQITADTTELLFRVRTEDDSPEGNHKNIFCQVVVQENSEHIVHARLGNTELRVDKPAPMVTPPAAETAAAPAQPQAPTPPAEKRLTRLEKLRLEAQQRASGTPTAGN